MHANADQTPATHAPILRVRGLSKTFGAHAVLRNIDLDVMPGERIAIIGGSGSGKSTLLRCLNFMDIPDTGRLWFNEVAIGKVRRPGTSPSYRPQELERIRQRIGMVFQQFNLFPHLTVLENVMEGPVHVLNQSRHEARTRAIAELERVGLAERLDSYPAHLSGGQQQRVAIARALAMSPDILLFDEPTSSLDPELVGEVLRTIRSLADSDRTMLLVTHELGFAYHFATRVIFLADGVFHETGTPEQVLRQPIQPRTRDFVTRFAEFSF